MSEDFLILCLQARMTWRSLHQLQIIKLMQRFVILSSYNLGTDCSHSILGCWIQFQCVPLPVCVCACVCGFPSHQQAILWTQLNILHFNRILTLSTWRQHLILQVKCSLSQGCPPLRMLIPSPGCHLHFSSTRYKSEVPMISFLGLINLLK